jgi:uncharacterized protein (TIGR02246 family)
MHKPCFSDGRFFRFLCAAVTVLILAHASPARAGDEAAIRRIVAQLESGWNAGDGEAFAAPFASDADYVIVNGMRIKGRAAIDEGHRRIFSTVYKGSRNAASILAIRFLRGDVAVAHVEWHLKFYEARAPREKKAITTLVLVKEGGRWIITAFQNTPIVAG